MDLFALHNSTRGKTPRVPFSFISEKILGKNYELSVVIVGATRMQHLNTQYRKKNEPTDILSFPYSKHSGEIFLHLASAEKKAPLFGFTPRQYLVYVFIHGCLHLKGMEHGRTMEKREDAWCGVFGIPTPKR